MRLSLKRFFKEERILFVAIGVVAFLILHNFIVGLYTKDAQEKFSEFQDTQREALYRIEQIGRFVNLIDLGFRGYYVIPEDQLLSPLNIAREDFPVNMDSLAYIMNELQYSQIDSIHTVKDWIFDYISLADQGVEFIQQDQAEKAAALFATDPGYDLWVKYDKVQQSMRTYVTGLNRQKVRFNSRINQYAFISQLTLAFFGLMTLGFVVFKLRKNEKAIDMLFNEIKNSNKEYVYNDGEGRENEKNEEVIGRLTGNLKKAAEFIRAVTSGNLEVSWEGMDDEKLIKNKETLAGELTTMRDQMLRVRIDESNRIWVSEGISQFSEVIRRNQDNLQIMADTLLAAIVKYVKANQGGIFFLSEENNDQYLEMTSCFAYDKKKFLERKIAADEGLLGQAFLEGEMIMLNQIPKDYVNITSGLGEATPSFIILIPLKFNEKVVGVMELAAFRPFTEIQVELLQKISEIVASAVVNSQNASKMKSLLETAHQNAEEMRAQEEEMRQNMEELQATQEELARKEREMMDRIEELEQKTEKTRVIKN